MGAQGVVGAALLWAGAWPTGGSSAAGIAAFPLDVFFDLKQALATGSSWSYVLAAFILSTLVRSFTVSATLWLGDGAGGPFIRPWANAAAIAGASWALFLPSTVLLFTGTALRYAPFLWIGGALGIGAAWPLMHRALRLDAGESRPEGPASPSLGGFLGYAYFIAATAAVLSVLERSSNWAGPVLLVCLGPIHALILLGWRQRMREGERPRSHRFGIGLTVVLAGTLVLSSFYDRHIRSQIPLSPVAPGTLTILGGVDSTSETGALSDLDPRSVGFDMNASVGLSYRAGSEEYVASDTRGDLRATSRTVSRQLEELAHPIALLGHSQSALILDRLYEEGMAAPDIAVQIAPPPPVPPSVDIPDPGENSPGRPGADLARGFSRLLDVIGFSPLHLDAPASPTKLDAVIVSETETARVSVWALGDSVWLEGDWRRPGEINVVAATDHVGAANNGRALATARSAFIGEPVGDEGLSWRSLYVSTLRYVFEPWRPR